MKQFTAILLSATLAAAEKVRVELYFESLCPYCQDDITGVFAEAFNTPGFLDMADVLMVPYGNAHEYPSGDSWTFTCQHGADECVYNEIESCSNKYIADKLTAFNFINCVESNDSKRKLVY
jgi:interferon gamma-inducible protein 30